jgi:hypothetical protein
MPGAAVYVAAVVGTVAVAFAFKEVRCILICRGRE